MRERVDSSPMDMMIFFLLNKNNSNLILSTGPFFRSDLVVWGY